MLAQPTWPGASHHQPLPVGRGGTTHGARAGATPPGCLPASPGHRDASRLLLGAASTPWTPLSPPLLSPLSSPAMADTPISRRRRSRRHHLSLDPSPCLRAPPRHPRPPRFATRSWTRPSALTELVPDRRRRSKGRRRHSARRRPPPPPTDAERWTDLEGNPRSPCLAVDRRRRPPQLSGTVAPYFPRLKIQT